MKKLSDIGISNLIQLNKHLSSVLKDEVDVEVVKINNLNLRFFWAVNDNLYRNDLLINTNIPSIKTSEIEDMIVFIRSTVNKTN